MPDSIDRLLAVATEIRELLQLLAEPAIAQRDEKWRAELRLIVGKSPLKRRAAILMDGTKSQLEIRGASRIDQGDLSKLVKSLRSSGLLTANEKPQIKIPLPTNFFEVAGG